MDFSLRLEGGQFDERKAHAMFKIQYEAERPDLVIIFRDLDGPAADQAMRRKRGSCFLRK